MDDINIVTLTLYYVHGTEKAYCFSKAPKGEQTPSVQYWIPRSQIKRAVKYPAEANKWPLWEIEIPEWLAEDKDLL